MTTGSVGVVSALGAVIAIITIILILMVGFMIFKTYVRGEYRYVEAPKVDEAKPVIDEEKSEKHAAGGSGNQRDGGSPQHKRSSSKAGGGQPLELDAIDLEVDDGNANNKSPMKPQPAAPGGVSGMALDRKLREKFE